MDVQGFEPRLRAVAFNVVSVSTTTGFATHDFDAWPQIMRGVLLCLMLAGGCMGSTAGGMKMARLIVFAKTTVRELHRFVSPHAVQAVRVGERVIEPQIVANILVFGAVYTAAFLGGALVMAACGYELTTALSASAAALGNVGPGLGAVGPATDWSHVPISQNGS